MKVPYLFLFLFSILIKTSNAQESWGGSPFIDYFKAKDYNAHPQNFSLVEGADGLMYFGNNDGILEFDGEYWRLFFTELGSPVFSLYRSDNFGIMYCAYDEFGRVLKDSLGQAYCESIYRDDEGNSGRFIDIIAWRNSMLCYSESCLLVYDSTGTDTLYPDFPIFSVFPLGNKLLIQDMDGHLYAYEGAELVPTEYAGLEDAYEIQKSIEARIVIARNAIYTLNQKNLQRLYTDIDYIIERSVILDAVKTSNNNYWLSLQGEGLFLINPRGKLLEHVGRRNGLRDLVNKEIALDRFGALWLASYNGLMRINFELGIKKFSQEEGVYGGVESMCFTALGPVVGTSEGVFLISNQQSEYKTALLKEGNQVKAIPNLSMQCWSLIPHPRKANHVLAAMNDGLYDIDLEKRSYEMKLECYPWSIAYDSSHKLLLLGLDPGFMLLDPDEVQPIMDLKEVEEPITCIQKYSENEYWLSANYGALYQLRLDNTSGKLTYRIRNKTEKTGLSDQGFRVLVHDKELYLYGSLGFYQYDLEKDTARYIDSMGFIDSHLYIHRASSDNEGNIWLAAANEANRKFIGRFSKTSGFDYSMFEPLSDAMPQVIVPRGKAEVWLGSNNGLFVFKEFDFQPRKTFTSFIRQVRLSSGDTLSLGGSTKPFLDYTENDIYFKFSAAKVTENNAHYYAYQLIGYSEAWSEWSSVSEVNFTNLESGNYELRVKSKNLYGIESAPANFSFSIDTPWYQSPWYYLGQAMFFVLLIALTYFFSRSKVSSTYSEFLVLVTVITLFEFVILYLEPFVDDYANGVPIFKLAMNIALALSLHPMERVFRRVFNKKKLSA